MQGLGVKIVKDIKVITDEIRNNIKKMMKLKFVEAGELDEAVALLKETDRFDPFLGGEIPICDKEGKYKVPDAESHAPLEKRSTRNTLIQWTEGT